MRAIAHVFYSRSRATPTAAEHRRFGARPSAECEHPLTFAERWRALAVARPVALAAARSRRYTPGVADNSDEQARIYDDGAEAYDTLIAHEDHKGALVRELERIAPLTGAEVADVGAGTGRISLLLAGRAKRLVLVERAPAMLAIAKRKLEALGVAAEFHEADARELPLADASIDVAIAGWVFGHFRHWMPEGWRTEVRRAADEMWRVVRPGGHVVVIETLGTGHTEPREHAALDEYFGELAMLGFDRSWVRTDYEFASVDEAVAICGPFFGADLVARIRENGWRVVPECTAVFTQRRP
jgi:ubiquinone/menaquinone biosynthesis C-methylase UbiE